MGMEPTEKEKGSWRVKRKVDRSVDTAWPIVISAFRVEEVPGEVAERSLRMLTPRR